MRIVTVSREFGSGGREVGKRLADAHLTDRELERKIRQIDKNRADNHDLISSVRWGDRAGYDLCVNTTNIVIKDAVPAIAAYAEKYFEDKEAADVRNETSKEE